MENKFKSIPVSELQSIISKALSAALEEKLNVTISSVDFKDSFSTKASFTVEVWKDNQFLKDLAEKKS